MAHPFDARERTSAATYRAVLSGTPAVRSWIPVWLAIEAVVVIAAMFLWPEFILQVRWATPRAYVSVTLVHPKPQERSWPSQVTMKRRRPAAPKPVAANPTPRLPLPNPTAAEIGPILRADLLAPSIHEIKIAVPQVSPAPEVRAGDVPSGMQGDIVVEVLIDKDGKVIRTKVQQAFAGLETKITEALLRWHFQPATYDGVPVASLQDIHFHYPDDAVQNR